MGKANIINKQKYKIQAEKTYAKNREVKKSLINDRLKYISILQNEFKLRRQTNLFYSLRDFATDLMLDPIHLSRILRNKKGLSRKKAEVIARKLNLPFSERKKFLMLVSAASARSEFERNLAKYGLKNALPIKLLGC